MMVLYDKYGNIKVTIAAPVENVTEVSDFGMALRTIMQAIANPIYLNKQNAQLKTDLTGTTLPAVTTVNTVSTVGTVTNVTNMGTGFPAEILQRNIMSTLWAETMRNRIV